jgi:hypothetical protein
MKITKNKNGTFDLKEVSMGKLMAIVNAINHTSEPVSIVAQDVRDIIANNPDYQNVLADPMGLKSGN